MKRKLKKLLCILIALSMFSSFTLLASANDAITETGKCGEDITYKLYDNGKLIITGTGEMYDFQMEGSPFWKKHITNVSISDGVTSVGKAAFYKTPFLISVDLPDGLIDIGDLAFHSCSALSSIVIPESVTSIGNAAFSGCGDLTSVNIPGGVTSVGNALFCECVGLTSLTIPDGVTSIGDFAFKDCSGITTLVVPDSVSSIGESAFENCKNLTSLNIPDGVTSIETRTFYCCSGLTSLVLPDGVTSIGNDAFCGCSGLTSIVVPDSVGSIGEEAFRNCKSLTSVDIPKGITSIGKYTFYDCSGLTSVVVPDSVTSIGSYAFYGCSGCKSLKLPGNMTFIGNYAFYGCSGITSLKIPHGITSIRAHTFSDCSGLTSLVIPDSVTSIGNNAFFNCKSLTSVDIPASVKTIGISTFENCTGMTSVSIPEGVTSINSYAFKGCSSLKSVTIPGSLTDMGAFMFRECTSLTEVTVNNGVNTIRNYAFYLCPNIKSVSLPVSVTSIETDAFLGCNKLEKITIPEEVTSISSSAFTRIGDYPPRAVVLYVYKGSYGAEYAKTTGLPYVYIDGTEEENTIKGNMGPDFSWKIDKETGILELSGTGTMPDFRQQYPKGVFYKYRHYITGINITGTFDNIGGSLFRNCIGLQEVSIPDGIKKIGEDAFNNCYNITEVSFPPSVEVIDYDAFDYCINLHEIHIKDIAAWCNVEQKNSSLINYNGKLFINGKKAENIVIPEGVTEIKDHAFINSPDIVSVTLPSTLKKYNPDAIVNCPNIEKITFALDDNNKSQLTVIPESAFSQFQNLKEIVIPASVTKIQGYAFNPGLEKITICNPDCRIENNPVLNENTEIIGFKGSTAETLAKNKGCTFTDIETEHEHKFKPCEIKKAPTCSETGIQTGRCSCGKETEIILEKLPHTPGKTVIENRTEPTCTEKGHYDEVVYCTVCEEELSRNKVEIPASGHKMETVAKKTPSCTEAGNNEYYHCTGCDKYFKDAEGKTETTVEAEVIEALGHTMEEVAAVEPTCTTAGNNKYYHCIGCDKYFKDAEGKTETTVEAEILEARGHNMVKAEAVAPTCTTNGNNEYYHCTICDKYYKDADGRNETSVEAETLNATGHDWDEGTVTKEPTYTETGIRTFRCRHSGCTETRTEVIPKLIMYGDLDGNLKITAADARFVLRMSVKLEDITDGHKLLADMDGDGNIDASDARTILRMSVGL